MLRKHLILFIRQEKINVSQKNGVLDVPPTPAVGSTVYCNQDGRAPISYHIHTASTFFIVTSNYGAQMQYPDGYWNDWYEGQSGGWVFYKQGTYHLEGRIYVVYEKRGHQGNYSESVEYLLLQNYPNPFNPSTTIRYSIKEPGIVRLEIYDILGNMIKVLVNEYRDIGSYDAVFDAASLPSGIYFYKIRVNNFTSIQKMQLIK